MSPVLLWLAILGGLAVGVVVLRAMARHGQRHRQSEADPKAGDFHSSNANFGNSLQGDNIYFSRGFYDE